MDDDSLWETVQREGRFLITTDKGFSRHRNSFHCGILIIRLRQPNRKKIHQRVMNTLNRLEAEKWPGQLIIIRDTVQSAWRFEGETQKN
jgi:hypothetical protein